MDGRVTLRWRPRSRIDEVAREITEYLKSTDRMQKTIVFCASEDHAERMRIALINHNADMVKENPDYCVRITGSDVYGKSKLDYFISVSSPYPVIATTSELLSTGADCKMTKLIVLDKTVESMTTFKQIIGRGTRIREKDGKTHFVVMDFRNVTRLFTDPDWDGPIEQDEGFQHGGGGNKPKGGEPGGSGEEPPVDPVETPIVDKDGCRVKIINKTVSVYDANGKLLRQEDIIDYTRTNIKGEYASLSDFIHKWKASDKKKTIEQSFIAMGIDLKALKAEQGMSDVDDFDFICYVAYGKKPMTRKERAITEGATDWKHMKAAFSKLSQCPENVEAYRSLDFDFLEYEPEQSTKEGALKIQMSNTQLTSMCKHFASIPQPRKLIFIADADDTSTNKELGSESGFKVWGNNVYSFTIPVPAHRTDTPKICIEHYYSDNDIKTQVEINGVQRRIYMGNEFDSVGISVDGQLCCVDRNSCGPDKIRIIDGTSDKRVFCIQGDRKTNLALPKMEFADRVLGNSPEYSNIDFSSFSLIFDIINKICDQ